MLYIVKVPDHYSRTVNSHAAARKLVTFWARLGVHASYQTIA